METITLVRHADAYIDRCGDLEQGFIYFESYDAADVEPISNYVANTLIDEFKKKETCTYGYSEHESTFYILIDGVKKAQIHSSYNYKENGEYERVLEMIEEDPQEMCERLRSIFVASAEKFIKGRDLVLNEVRAARAARDKEEIRARLRELKFRQKELESRLGE